MNELSSRLKVYVQVKVSGVLCWNATIHKVVAVKSLVSNAAPFGVGSI